MGIYDIYEGSYLQDWYDEKYPVCVQLKIGDVGMRTYKIGDRVELSDGIYVGYEGLVVIKDHKLIEVFLPNMIYDKWGCELTINLDEGNIVAQTCKDFKEKHESK